MQVAAGVVSTLMLLLPIHLFAKREKDQVDADPFVFFSGYPAAWTSEPPTIVLSHRVAFKQASTVPA